MVKMMLLFRIMTIVHYAADLGSVCRLCLPVMTVSDMFVYIMLNITYVVVFMTYYI